MTLSVAATRAADAPAQDYLFDPDALADQLYERPLEGKFEPSGPFGPALDRNSSNRANSGGNRYTETWIDMGRDGREAGIWFTTYATTAQAEEELINTLITEESILPSGGYRLWTPRIQIWNDKEGLDLTATCGHRPEEEGPVTEVRCAILPEGGQTIVGSYGSGQNLTDSTELSSFVLEVTDPLPDALAFLTEAEAALIGRGGAAAWPKAGWRLGPDDLRAHLMAMRFTGDEQWPETFGAPQPPVYEEPSAKQRERGLYGRVIVALDGDGTRNGVEYWIFHEAAQREDERTLVDLVTTPESQRAGAISQQGHTLIGISADGVNQTLRMVCGRIEKVPREGRCRHLRSGSQVAIVAYSYGRALGHEDGAYGGFTSEAFDAIEIARDKFAEIEQPLIAALREGRDAPPPSFGDTGAQTGGFDTHFLGRWQLFLPLGNSFVRLQLQFNPDGSYALTSDTPGVMTHSGRFMAHEGTWSITSPQWQDAGTYSFPNAQTMILTGKLGPGVWARAK